MKLLVMMISILLSYQAMADGFICYSPGKALKFKLYNHVHPRAGTRNPAILIISDPHAKMRKKTITTVEGDLIKRKEGNHFEVAVAGTMASFKNGRRLFGFGPEQISNLQLELDFEWANPLLEGTRLTGRFTVNNIYNRPTVVKLICYRYLKNPRACESRLLEDEAFK